MTKLILNAVAIESAPESKIVVGRQAYSPEALEALRREHRGDYVFRRGGNDGQVVFDVPLKAGLLPLGASSETLAVSKVPWLVGPLAVEALLGFFTSIGRPVLRWRPLRVLSQQPANLLPADAGLPDWLQRRVVLEFETRSIKTRDHDAGLVLVCGVRTRNSIDASCAAILEAGVPLVGRYVSTYRPSEDERVRGANVLAGRVVEVGDGVLRLEDHGAGPASVPAAEAFLEPRKENLVWCARHLIGARADRALAAADVAASKQLSGPGRLDLTRRTFDYLRRQSIELAPGAPLVLGPLAGDAKGSWPFRSETIAKPSLVFDPSGARTDTWNERGLDVNGPYDQRTFTPKQLRVAVVCQAAYEGQVDGFLAKFLDGLPQVKTPSGDRAPYAKGFIRRYALEAPRVQTFTARSASAADYTAACRAAIEAASNGGFEWNLAIVQIDQDFRELPGPDNPYFAVKAAFLKQRVPVQEITLETMRLQDRQLVYALNNMSVATYAKVGGVPWLLKSQPSVAHELVVGIGSHTLTTSRLGSQERFVGITTVFSSDGRYLLDDRTAAVPYDEYEDALFKSLSRSIEQVRRIDNWRSTDAVRLIFHVFKQMKDIEVDAVGRLVDSLGLSDVKYAFLHVVDDHPLTLFDEDNQGVRWAGELKGVYAPQRGLAVRLGDTETLLCFTGSHEVKQAQHGLPQSVLLRLHRRSTFRDMTYLTRQAFEFSGHSWRMFSPAPHPITIHYSELIARLLTGLRHVPNWDPDAMLGPIGRTRWFL